MGILQMKRIYEVPAEEDGRRVLVDRLWPRGMKKERAVLALWAKEVAPSKELRRLYHGGELPFAGFAAAYLEELEGNPAAREFAEQCRAWLSAGNVTLVFATKNLEENHVQVLLRWLRHALA